MTEYWESISVIATSWLMTGAAIWELKKAKNEGKLKEKVPVKACYYGELA